MRGNWLSLARPRVATVTTEPGTSWNRDNRMAGPSTVASGAARLSVAAVDGEKGRITTRQDVISNVIDWWDLDQQRASFDPVLGTLGFLPPEQTGRLRQIFGLAEAYPQLTADASFLGLQRTLADTESRIAGSRTSKPACASWRRIVSSP